MICVFVVPVIAFWTVGKNVSISEFSIFSGGKVSLVGRKSKVNITVILLPFFMSA